MAAVYGRRMARKVLAEFAHEQIIHPIPLGPGPDDAGASGAGSMYLVVSDDQSTEYVFRAEVLSLDNWVIDGPSMRRLVDGADVPVDPVAMLLDLRERLAIAADAVPAYLEEFVNTLGLGADRPDHLRVPAAELARADFQTVEQTMTEGHPCIVANAGRIGFSSDDVARYAPERGEHCRLVWVAAPRGHCEVAAMSDHDHHDLLRGELGSTTLDEFDAELRSRGLDPADFLYLPVHPWQWNEKVARVFARELAEGTLVCVGEGTDLYRPQQSIRTLFNADEPRRHYVKLALSITNMGFTRGMSADYMRTTPLINDWVRDRVGDDPFLRSVGFTMVFEVVAIGYRNPVLQSVTEPGSEYRKLMSALWRQSPVGLVDDDQQLMTMAALLHIDHRGDPLVGALVERSGLSATAWLARYLRTYLHPIIHLLYRYRLKFSPHGENLILVLADGVPVRAILKDIGEEVTIGDDAPGLPESCRRAVVPTDDAIGNLGILSDVFDDFLRPLAGILHQAGLCDDASFWKTVADSVTAYIGDHPDLADRFARWDLFAPDFGAIHMNRLQLGNSRRMVDLGDSYAALLDTDHRLVNPIARYAPSPPSAAQRP
ncbi:IucA/IucC family protein [Williamsia sp. MIQD14]|uniref:IucA/IucC family protein n=1 Tax=Williamsia sp. MIQD14 TaxID=3425703 RepID=UPI003DA073FC